MTDVQMLPDREAIKETKARYFRYLDTKQWDRLRSVFTDDAKFQPSGVKTVEGQPPMADPDGPDDFVRSVSAILATRRTVHHGHMPEIRFTGPDTAEVICAMFDIVDDHGTAKSPARNARDRHERV